MKMKNVKANHEAAKMLLATGAIVISIFASSGLKIN